MQRSEIFDRDRNLIMANQHDVEELLEVIRRQEAELQKLQLQQQRLIQQQQQQQTQQQTQQQQQQTQHQQQEFNFNMTAKDVIDQFRRLKPLSENQNSRAFINAVESNLALCGTNLSLIQFCLRIVADEKIHGNAGWRVRELESGASWEEMKGKIQQECSPKTTYGEVFNLCRTIKVRNLRELFNIFETSKFNINDIYLSDPLKPGIYRPENVDRDLVDILLEKIDGPIRAHLSENATLNEIITKYTKLKLLDDTRAIAFNHRVNIQSERKTNNNWQSLKPSNSFHSNNWNTNNCFQNTNWQKSKPNNNFQNGNFKPNSSIQTRNFNWQNSDPYHRSQYRLINNFPVENYSRNSTQQLNSSKFIYFFFFFFF